MADIAPTPQFPERALTMYERKFSPALPGNRGPLRFEEGLATDTDIPDDFALGMAQGYMTAPGRPNHNANVYEKYPEETIRERAHVGSAAWVEAPEYLAEFAHGSFNDYAAQTYEMSVRSGSRQYVMNPATVMD